MSGTKAGSQIPLLQAIYNATDDARVRLAMIFGALEEGGSLTGPWGVGDQSSGGSYGPYQIHLIAHPGVTAAEAQRPRFAANFMVHSYEEAVKSVPDSLWKTDPAAAVEMAAYHAERPAVTYSESRGTDQVQTTYKRARRILGGHVAVGGPAAASGSTAAGTSAAGLDGGATGAVSGILDAASGAAFHGMFGGLLNPLLGVFDVADFQDLAERAALILFGGLLIIVGLVMLVKDTQGAKAAEGIGLLVATDGAAATGKGAATATARTKTQAKARAAKTAAKTAKAGT